MEGWVRKEGKSIRFRKRRFLRFDGTMLSHYKKKEATTPTWEVDITECRVSVGNRSLELVLTLDGSSMSFFAVNGDEYTAWLAALKSAVSKPDDYYTFGKTLGKGSYGEVFLGCDKVTNEMVAIKYVAARALVAHLERGDFLLPLLLRVCVRVNWASYASCGLFFWGVRRDGALAACAVHVVGPAWVCAQACTALLLSVRILTLARRYCAVSPARCPSVPLLLDTRVIKRNPSSKRQVKFIERESSILKAVDHEHIVKTLDIFDRPDSLVIVTEFLEGGELFSRIIDEKCFTEQKARDIMRQILLGVQYLHSLGIVHRYVWSDACRECLLLFSGVGVCAPGRRSLRFG